MDSFPHKYKVKAEGTSLGSLTVSSENLPPLTIAPPLQFGGPGDAWSPEDLLMASVANCFILSFRAIAKASKLEWDVIECNSDGELAKADNQVKFTGVVNRVRLLIPENESIEKAEKLLNKAESVCIISNSLSCKVRIECEIDINGR